jgi:hypothetical protein
MKYREFAPAQIVSPERLSTATLYLAHPEEWQRLDHLRRSYGPTSITGRRDLAPRFPGWSVDVRTMNPEEAARLLGDWCSRRAGRPDGDGSTAE